MGARGLIRWPRSAFIVDMTDSSASTFRRRRIPVWGWVVLALAVLAALVIAPIVVITGGIFGYQAATAVVETAADRDKKLTAADPDGGKACDLLDMANSGVGSTAAAITQASTAKTDGIRAANSPDALYEACTAAGANMSPR